MYFSRHNEGAPALRPTLYLKLWKDKCAFHGVDIEGTVDELKDRIRVAPNGMTPKVRDLQGAIEEELRIKNAEAEMRKGAK